MLALTSTQAADIAHADARAIANEASTCIFGFPLLVSYHIVHACVVDRAIPEYKVKVDSSRSENQ